MNPEKAADIKYLKNKTNPKSRYTAQERKERNRAAATKRGKKREAARKFW